MRLTFAPILFATVVLARAQRLDDALADAATDLANVAGGDIANVATDLANAATSLAGNAATDIANAATSLANNDNIASITSLVGNAATSLAHAGHSVASDVVKDAASVHDALSSKFATYSGWEQFTAAVGSAGSSASAYLATQTALPSDAAKSAYEELKTDVAGAPAASTPANGGAPAARVAVGVLAVAVGFVVVLV